jgi:uncharacterized protein YjbI with pentapeptide repeats
MRPCRVHRCEGRFRLEVAWTSPVMIRGEDHTGITFQSEDFSEADLSESSFERCSFRGTLLGRSRMVSVRLDRSGLFGVDAANCLLTESKIAGTTAVDCRLLGADFRIRG